MVHIFQDKKRVLAFALRKNARVKKGKWVVEKGKHGGWIAWHKKTPSQQLLQ